MFEDTNSKNLFIILQYENISRYKKARKHNDKLKKMLMDKIKKKVTVFNVTIKITKYTRAINVQFEER